MTSWEATPPDRGTSPPEHPPVPKNWVTQLETFVRQNQPTLAALNWALHLEQGPEKDTIGIDFEPSPHLVFCRREAIATLNEQVNHQLREVIGILNGHKPEQEVFILGIGPGQSCEFKLIQFQPNPDPPTCYKQRSQRIAPDPAIAADLAAQLEAELNQLA